MTTSSRDHGFPATSIGRSAGIRIQRNPSQDSMTSHPLLSPNIKGFASPLVANASIGGFSSGHAQSIPTTQAPITQQVPPPPATQHQRNNSSHTSHAQSHHHPHNHQHVNAHTAVLNVPRYVPYTPRHRASPTATTSFASGVPIHSQTAAGHTQHQSYHQNQNQPQLDVATRLKITNLKAAVQDIGLDMGSVGWAIVERLIGVHTFYDGWTGEGSEWEEIWKLITTEKAVLLLPMDQLHPSERITTEFIKDHVVLCDAPSRSGAQIVTLSGLRGVIEGDKLVFRSSISPASKLFQSLLFHPTRSEAISRLPPLPKFITPPSAPQTSTTVTASSDENSSHISTPTRISPYPTFTVPTQTILPVPPRHTILSSLSASHSSSTSSLASSSSTATFAAASPSTKSFLSPRITARSLSNSSTHSAPGVLQVQSGPLGPPPPPPTMTATTTMNSQVNSATSTPLMTISRLPNPFASLFGRNPNTTAVHSDGYFRTGTPPPASPVHIQPPARSGDGQEASATASVFQSPPVSTGDSTPSSTASSAATSITAVSTTTTGNAHLPVEISVFTIDKRVLRREVGRAMNRVLRAEVKARLIGSSQQRSVPTVTANANATGTSTSSAGGAEPDLQDKPTTDFEIQSPGQVLSPSSGSPVQVPSWVIERVHEFTTDWYPVVKGPLHVGIFNAESGSSSSVANGGGLNGNGNGNGVTGPMEKGYIANMLEETPEEVTERLQDFYLWLEEDLDRIEGDGFKKKWIHASANGGGSGRATPSPPGEKDKDVEGGELRKSVLTLIQDEKEGDKEGAARKIRNIVEVVEKTICELFYDRLFMQPTSDDASHDEALSSRVAALNMLDLGLEHLDVIVSDEEGQKEKVGEVVKACGDMLGNLETCYCPADKAAVLVQAHKVVVDGLSKLPPVRLKSDDEKEAEKAKKAEEAQATPKVPAPGIGNGSAVPTEKAPAPTTSQGHVDDEEASETQPLLQEGESQQDETVRLVANDQAQAPPADSEKPRQHKPTPVSGDVLLPMIIFSVVKANPNHLVSALLYTQRFRNQTTVGNGEESYCLINLMAVAEFLENVDLEGLGLTGEGRGKVTSAADLKPIQIARSPRIPSRPLTPNPNQNTEASSIGALGGLRGRVEQQVDALAGSANKVLTGVTGVVDTSFGLLRSFLPGAVSTDVVIPGMDSTQGSAPWNAPARAVQSGFGLLRRESGFSIASIAASIPGAGGLRGKSGGSSVGAEEVGQQMVAVSRPGSSVRSRSRSSFRIRVGAIAGGNMGVGLGVGVGEDGESEGVVSESEGENESGREDDAVAAGLLSAASAIAPGGSDTRSIRSFESMLNSRNGRRKGRSSNLGVSLTPPSNNGIQRKSLTDRLASVPGLKGSSTPGSSRPSSPAATSSVFPGQSITPPQTLRLAPPKQRFLECSADDMKISEVRQLLKDYRRLVEGIRGVGGFIEEEKT